MLDDQTTPAPAPQPVVPAPSTGGESIWLKVLLIILVLVIVALLGWWLYKYQGIPATETTGTDNSSQTSPAVDDSSDLAEAEQYLADTDIDAQLDTSEIDSALN